MKKAEKTDLEKREHRERFRLRLESAGRIVKMVAAMRPEDRLLAIEWLINSLNSEDQLKVIRPMFGGIMGREGDPEVTKARDAIKLRAVWENEGLAQSFQS